MKCSICNGNTLTLRGTITFESKVIGTILVPGITFSKCENCSDKLYDLENSHKVIKYVRKKEQEAINELPFSCFISANTAAEILEITKQAFSKNHKIKKGFIYSSTLDGKTYYYKDSVFAFKQTGDGRIPLSQKKELAIDASFSETFESWSESAISQAFTITPAALKWTRIKGWEDTHSYLSADTYLPNGHTINLTAKHFH